jgi:hypothetical protein
MMELRRYGQHLGVSAFPPPNEDTPLVSLIGATATNQAVE